MEVGQDATSLNNSIMNVANSTALGIDNVTKIAVAGGAAGVAVKDMEDYSKASAVFADGTGVSSDSWCTSVKSCTILVSSAST
jgi:hypothetical protein